MKIQRDVGTRWTPDLVADGWTPVSDYFLKNYHRLRPQITSLEAMFIVHLMLHKWDADPPRPSLKTIAQRMGVSSTAVRNHARNLERKRLLKRQHRVGAPSRYDLTPLFTALEALRAEDVTVHADDEQLLERSA